MYKKVFTINGKYPHIGYTDGDDWNGWATPYFEFDEAMAISNEFTQSPMYYNKEHDTFYHFGTENISGEMWRGSDILTAEGIKHLYGIGAYSWVWELTTKEDIEAVAQGIEEFIYEYDTYGYRDVGIDREEMVKEIMSQLKDFNTLKQVLNALYTEELTEDKLFEELRKELKV